MNEQLKEKIKFLTEWLRIFILLLLANISGEISLAMIPDKSPANFVFIILGIFSILALLILAGIASYQIDKNIKNLSI